MFSCFIKFKTLVEKENIYSIKSLRTDRSGEFFSNNFNKFCEDNGIKRLLTVPRFKKKNGVVERNNKSILNMARAWSKPRRCLKRFGLKL